MGGDGQGEKTVSRGGGGASLSGVGGGQGQKNVEKTSGPMASKPADYDNFWEAPGYLWKIPEVSDRESEAVMVSARFVRKVSKLTKKERRSDRYSPAILNVGNRSEAYGELADTGLPVYRPH